MHYVYSILVIIGGVFVEFNVFRIVRTFGHLAWWERNLGAGGSYTFWRLVGFALIIFGLCSISYYDFLFPAH